MSDERQDFRATHLATGINSYTNQPFSNLRVMVQGDHAFSEEEWESRRGAKIVRDQSRNQWCHGGAYKPVAMVPLP